MRALAAGTAEGITPRGLPDAHRAYPRGGQPVQRYGSATAEAATRRGPDSEQKIAGSNGLKAAASARRPRPQSSGPATRIGTSGFGRFRKSAAHSAGACFHASGLCPLNHRRCHLTSRSAMPAVRPDASAVLAIA